MWWWWWRENIRNVVAVVVVVKENIGNVRVGVMSQTILPT